MAFRVWKAGLHELVETVLRERRNPQESVILEEPGRGTSLWTVVSVERDPHGWRTTATRCLPGCTEHPGTRT